MLVNYPDDNKDNLLGYQELHNSLLVKEPMVKENSNMTIMLDPILKVCEKCTGKFREIYSCSECPLYTNDPTPEDIDSYDVYGYDSMTPETKKWGLDFSPRSEWLGYEVDDNSIKKLGPATALAHIYWEMTFHGFNEENVEARGEELKVISDELNEAIKNGDTSKYVTSETIEKMFGIDNDEFEKEINQITNEMLDMVEKKRNEGK